MEQRIEQLEKLLSEKKYDEAKRELDAIIRSKLPEKERGEMILVATEMYSKAMIQLNKERADMLRKAIYSLEVLRKEESKIGDQIRVAEVKQSLK
jgi:phosphopantetheine adenylyltransferase